MQFGTYTFPLGWGCTEDNDEQEVPMQQTARRDGAAWLPGRRKARVWTLDGGFVRGWAGTANTDNGVRDQIDALKAALLSGPSNFYIDPDRYFRLVQLQAIPTKEDKAHRRYAFFTCKAVGPDPFAYSTTVTTTPEIVAAGNTYNYLGTLGNAYAQPTWYIEATAALNTAFDWTFTNTTTGEVVHLFGTWPVAGAGYFIVDSLNFTVQFAPSLGGTLGPADADPANITSVFNSFEGQFPRLNPGVNNFTLAHTGIAPGGAWAVFAGRYF